MKHGYSSRESIPVFLAWMFLCLIDMNATVDVS